MTGPKEGPGPKNPPPFRLMGRLPIRFEVEGRKYAIHHVEGRVTAVYEHRKTGDRKVKNPAAVRALVREYEAQQRRTTEFVQAVKHEEEVRKPVVARPASRWWRFKRWARLTWAALRARFTSRREEPQPTPVEVRTRGEMRALLAPGQSPEEMARLTEIIAEQHAKDDANRGQAA